MKNSHMETFRVKLGRGKGRSQPRWNDKSKIQCYYCRKFGHYENECKKKQTDSSKDKENVIREGNYEIMLFSCQVVEDYESTSL